MECGFDHRGPPRAPFWAARAGGRSVLGAKGWFEAARSLRASGRCCQAENFRVALLGGNARHDVSHARCVAGPLGMMEVRITPRACGWWPTSTRLPAILRMSLSPRQPANQPTRATER